MAGDAKGEYRGLMYRNDADLKAWLAQRPPEAVLEPDLPIIDPHHHFWDTPHRGRYVLPDLLADIGGGHNVVATVFLECQAMYRQHGPAEMAPIGEIWSVVNISPNIASTRAPRMSLGSCGAADMSSKNGGRRMNVLAACHGKVVPLPPPSERHCGGPSAIVA